MLKSHFWVYLKEKQKMRTGPGTDWASLGEAEALTQLLVVGEEGKWYKVFYGDYFAYVLKSSVVVYQ